MRDKDGQRFAFTLITQAGFAVRENVAQVLQRQFKDVGVEAAVQLHDGTSISKLWFEGKFDAMLHWWQLPADPELTLFFAKDRMPPPAATSTTCRTTRSTALVYAADRVVSQAERARILGRGAGAHRRPGHRDSALRRDQARRRAHAAEGLHRQSHQHRTVLERARVDARLGCGSAAAAHALEAVPLLLVVSGIAFGLLQLVPGGPLEVYLSNPGVRPEDLERLRRALGLDRPLWEQYVSWLVAFVRGDWGFSFSDGRPVLQRIVERLPASLELLGASLRAGAGRGDSRGHRRGGEAPHVRRPRDLGGGCRRRLDSRVLARPDAAADVRHRPGLAAVVRPRRRRRRPGAAAVPGDAGLGAGLRARGGLVALPAGVDDRGAASPFVAAARARGVDARARLTRHALPNALAPVATVVLLDAALLVPGAVVTESVFAWPGVGSLFTEALGRRDYTVLMAMLMVSSVAVVAFNLLADLLHAWLDPRVAS